MQFTKVDEDGTIEVSENGVIGYISVIQPATLDSDILFDFKAGVNPSLTLEEMKKIVEYMGKL